MSALARRPVLVAFTAALVVRATTAVVIAIGWGGSLFLDDATYSGMAQAAADGRLSSLGAQQEWLYERTGTLLVPITGLYELLGPVKLAGELYVALLGATTAALTARLALEVVERRFALLAGLLVALLPSQVLWSSIILKDAAVWACLSGLAVVVAVGARSTGRRLALLAVVAASLLVLLGFLRLQTLEVACVALTLAMLVSERAQRPVRVAGAVAMLVCVPLAFGMGVAGAPFVARSRDPGEQRAGNAQQARSAVVAPTPAATGHDDTSDDVTGEHARGAVVAPTPADGHDVTSDDDVTGELSYLPKGLAVVALRPWPWESSGGGVGVALARVEALAWYPLVALALFGLGGAWRRRQALAFPILSGCAVLVMYGLTEGNLGTAYRHRGELVWAVVLLATLGAERLVHRRQASTRASSSPTAT
jgi:hypothetical protein